MYTYTIGIRSVLVISIFSLLYISIARANDYNPNVVPVRLDVSTCVNVQNLEEFTDQYLVIYDLSPELGTKLGVPWVLVEQGVCYESAYSRDEYLYFFEKPVDQRIADLLGETDSYSPTDSLHDQIGMPDYDTYIAEIFGVFSGPPAPKVHESYRGFRVGLRGDVGYGHYLQSTQSNVRDTGIVLSELLPLRLMYDDGFSNYNLHYPDVHPGSGRSVLDVASSLQEDLEEVVRSCDQRQAVFTPTTIFHVDMQQPENGTHTYTPTTVPSIEYEGVVWDLGANGVVKRPTSTIASIEALGCTQEVQAYLNSNKDQIETLDALLADVEAKYPVTTEYGTVKESPFVRRTDEEYAGLVAYAYFGKRPEVELEDVSSTIVDPGFTQAVGATRPAPPETNERATSSRPNTIENNTLQPPTVEEQPSAVDTAPVVDDTLPVPTYDGVSTEDDTFLRSLYFILLPILGILGIGLLVLRSHRNKAQRHSK